MPKVAAAALSSESGSRADTAPRGLFDDVLVARLRSGDSKAFDVIYGRYHPEILWFCRRKLRSREDAEDAAQNAFISAYRDLLRSDNPIDLRPWLYGIARNRCLMALRARRPQTNLPDETIAMTEDAAEAVARRQDLRELFADLGELPDKQRAALLMSEFGGVPHAQIASTLECLPNQVKALVFQARTNLLDSRSARRVPCSEIREQISNSRGPTLLRRQLKRHIRACSGCREFAAAKRRERSLVALGLSILPGLGSNAAIIRWGNAVRDIVADAAVRAPMAADGWNWVGSVAVAVAATAGSMVVIGSGPYRSDVMNPAKFARLSPTAPGLSAGANQAVVSSDASLRSQLGPQLGSLAPQTTQLGRGSTNTSRRSAGGAGGGGPRVSHVLVSSAPVLGGILQAGLLPASRPAPPPGPTKPVAQPHTAPASTGSGYATSNSGSSPGDHHSSSDHGSSPGQSGSSNDHGGRSSHDRGGDSSSGQTGAGDSGSSSQGQGGDSHGHGGSSEGQGGDSQGQGGDSHGHGGSSQGQGGDSQGQGGDSQGQGGDSHGHGGSSQGQGGSGGGGGSHGHSD